MKSLITILIICLNLTSAEFRNEEFKLTYVKSFDTIETIQLKSQLECCGICLAKSLCEGVIYIGDSSCTLLSNVLTTKIGSTQAWILTSYRSNKAKILLVGGRNNDMELLNLATKQSYVLPFPLTWPHGGQVSDHSWMFCAYETEQKCVLVNTQSLEIEDLEVTVEKQKRSKAVSVEYEGNQVIWLTGGKIGDDYVDTSQITSLTENNPGPIGANLPIVLDAHCMVKINATTIAILAGKNIDDNSNRMWYFHIQDGQWVEGPKLKIARRYAGCGTFKDGHETYVIVVGGYVGGESKYTTNSEILNVRGNFWFDGPDMPFKSEKTNVGSLPDSLEGELAWVFGGANKEEKANSDVILRLHCQGRPEYGQCQWIEHDMKMKVDRNWGTVVTF